MRPRRNPAWPLTAALGLGVACWAVAGCSRPDREKLADEVLKADPTFVLTLDKHRELSSRIQQYQQELALKRTTVERTIIKLRQELVEATNRVRKKTAEARQILAPFRERLEVDLAVVRGQLRARKIQRSNLSRSVSSLQRLLRQDDANAGASMRAEREAQVQTLLAETKVLDEELAELKEHARITKLKLILLRL